MLAHDEDRGGIRQGQQHPRSLRGGPTRAGGRNRRIARGTEGAHGAGQGAAARGDQGLPGGPGRRCRCARHPVRERPGRVRVPGHRRRVPAPAGRAGCARLPRRGGPARRPHPCPPHAARARSGVGPLGARGCDRGRPVRPAGAAGGRGAARRRRPPDGTAGASARCRPLRTSARPGRRVLRPSPGDAATLAAGTAADRGRARRRGARHAPVRPARRRRRRHPHPAAVAARAINGRGRTRARQRRCRPRR